MDTVAFRSIHLLPARILLCCIFSTEEAQALFPSFFAEMAETVVRVGEGDGGAVRPELLHRREQEEAEGHHLPR